jgi:hypothetical protein
MNRRRGLTFPCQTGVLNVWFLLPDLRVFARKLICSFPNRASWNQKHSTQFTGPPETYQNSLSVEIPRKTGFRCQLREENVAHGTQRTLIGCSFAAPSGPSCLEIASCVLSGEAHSRCAIGAIPIVQASWLDWQHSTHRFPLNRAAQLEMSIAAKPEVVQARITCDLRQPPYKQTAKKTALIPDHLGLTFDLRRKNATPSGVAFPPLEAV